MRTDRILIVNLTRLGDLLQTSPTVEGLRARHPGASITLVAEKSFADVCEAIPGVDEVYRMDLDHLGRLLLAGGDGLVRAHHAVRETVEELRARRFDLALNFSSSRMSAVLLGLLRIPDVRGWSMTPDGFRAIRHPWARLFATQCLNRRLACFNLVDCYRGVAGCLDEPGPRRLRYTVADAARRSVAATLHEASNGDADGNGARPLVALQLGASRAIRRWPVESFRALTRSLVEQRVRVVLIGGAGERELADAVCAAGGDASSIVDLCGRTSIAELAALLERCALLVSGDTGPLHMAAAVGTPVLGLFFGPALPLDTGPYGVDHVVLQATPPCAPCDHEVLCLDPFCRGMIRPELVARVALARLRGDFAAIEEAARGLAGVVVHRTGFDADGLLECRPLGASGVRREDALRRAYRAVWLVRLEGRPLPPPDGAARLDAAPFATLAPVAEVGVELSRRLCGALGAVPDVGALERLGREVEALDRTIAEHGRVHPDAAPLAQSFAFDKEALPERDLGVLAEELARLYGELATSARRMVHLLGGGTPRREEDVADLRQ
ncbi:MAG: glycosyltransferase family 9 protein [Thermodesulfobacteriota bacterium]